MTALRHALGLDQSTIPRSDVELVKRRLDRQTARLQAIDARIDTDMASDTRITFRRRASDR